MNKRKTILVIDDDHDIRVSLRNSLEYAGYVVSTVANGKDALSIINRSLPPKLIILDLAMPIMNGVEFLRIKENDEDLKDIPTLVITALPEKILKIGDTPHVSKPIDMNVLLSTVEALFKKMETC